LLYQRILGDERFLIALNLGAQPVDLGFAKDGVLGQIVLSTRGDRAREVIRGSIALRDNEGVVLALAAESAV
jgi:alpha-glucosidase